MEINYYIVFPQELSAGLRGYEEEITILVDSGDPGGEDGEFFNFMKESLEEWFDGAMVTGYTTITKE